MTTRLSKELKNICEKAIDNGLATSISLFVGFDDKDSANDCKIISGSTTAETIYDLASLTKICGTTIAMAQAIVDGKISLDERPFAAWPITVRSILTHTSGLPAHKRFYEMPLSIKDFKNNLLTIKNELFSISPTSNKTRVYSDLGFIALGFLLEERLKKPLSEIFSESVPNNLFFISSTSPFFKSEQNFAPTGFCPTRKNVVLAQVHDPNCFFMGGHAAHAGLFGTLDDVKLFGQFFLSAVKNPDTPLNAKLREFAKEGIGFDRRSHTGTQAPLSPRAFGHFGFTGTSLWMDPGFSPHGLVVALLTNRVHKSEDPHGIYELRLKVNRAIRKFSS